MIEVTNLTKRYGRQTAVDGISFRVEKGEIMGFLGPNGAGKTTTMRILTCYLPPTEGTANVAGYDVFRAPIEVKKRVGYIPETPPLYPDMTVQEFLSFCSKIKGVASGDRKARIDDAIGKCRVGDVRDKLIAKLSKGYRQRVGLAQAIVSDPAVLILDEPTIGLDPQQITEIRALIKSLAGDHTVILSTHILPEVSMVCDAVVIINRGSIVAQGPVDRLVEDFFPTARVHVQIAAPAATVREGLAKIPGVGGVHEDASDEGLASFIVESARGRDVRGEIFQLAAQQQWELRELRRAGMTLEEVFIRIVAGEEAAPEPAPATAPAEVPET